MPQQGSLQQCLVCCCWTPKRLGKACACVELLPASMMKLTSLVICWASGVGPAAGWSGFRPRYFCLFPAGLQVLVALQQAGQASGSGTSARLDSLQGELGDAQQALAQQAQQHATEKASRLQDAAATARRLQVGFPASLCTVAHVLH